MLITWVFAHYLYVHLGIKGTGAYYGFWSGAGSDLGELAIFTAAWAFMLGWWHQHNCVTHGCYRLGWRNTAAGHYVCRKHHPDDQLTHKDILEAHNAALQ